MYVSIEPLNTDKKIGIKRWDSGFRNLLKEEARDIRLL